MTDLPVDLYLRQSSSTDKSDLSPEDQERIGRREAERRNLTIGEVIFDKDQSGGKWERKGLQTALRRVKEGTSGGIIIAWLDRLSRDSEHAMRLIREIDEAGGMIYAPDAPDDWKNSAGKLQVTIMFAFATYLRDRLGEGLDSAKRRAIMDKGIPTSATAPVGYRKDDNGKLVRDPGTAPWIIQVFELRAQGKRPEVLASLLEEHGVQTSKGRSSWNRDSIYSVIRNRTYLGEVRNGQYVNPHAHEALVDIGTWEAAQHPAGEKISPVKQESPYLLNGLIRCANCRYVMSGTMTREKLRIYRCAHKGCSKRSRVSQWEIENAVTHAFWQITEDLEAQRVDKTDLAPLKDALTKAERRYAQVQTPESMDALGDDWSTTTKLYREDRDQAAKALREAQFKTTSEPVDSQTLKMTWERMSTADRRTLLGLRFDCLAFAKDRSFVIYLSGTAPELPTRGNINILPPFDDAPKGSLVFSL